LILSLDSGVFVEENDTARSFCKLIEGVDLMAFILKPGKGPHIDTNPVVYDPESNHEPV